MRKGFLIVSLMAFFIVLNVEAAALNVIDDFDKALKISQLESKKAIVMFSDPGCFYCNKFKKETLKEEEVQNLLNVNFIFSEIYPDTNKKSEFLGQELTYRDLYGAFRVSGTPTFWFFTEEGTPLTFLPGFVDAQNFVKILRYMAQELYKKDIKFSDYINQKDDFIGVPSITEINMKDFDWLLKNDDAMVFIENVDNMKNFDPFTKYAVESKEIAEKLIKMGAYNVFLKTETVNQK
ncbi:MAG: thioredoxin fold domain-containing protein [Thermotogae bacterium]|nr:thioredoxin fold domain-containing protein [Thermotogota bacterium]